MLQMCCFLWLLPFRFGLVWFGLVCFSNTSVCVCVSVDMSVRMHTYIHRERKRQRAVYVGGKGSRKLGLEMAKDMRSVGSCTGSLGRSVNQFRGAKIAWLYPFLCDSFD